VYQAGDALYWDLQRIYIPQIEKINLRLKQNNVNVTINSKEV